MYLVYIMVDIFSPNNFYIHMCVCVCVCVCVCIKGFPGGSVGKESTCNAGDLGSIPGLGSSWGKENGSPLQDSGLENSIDCIVHVVEKSQTWLTDLHFHMYIHICIYIHVYTYIFILFMGFSRHEYWSGLPFPSPVDHILSDLSTMTRPSWVAQQAWLSFIELDKAVVLVWLDWLVFCEYGFSVFALWCPLATPTVLLGFLLLWVWSISSRLLQQSAAIAPYLGRGVSPHRHPSWPSMWDSSFRPSCARAATASWMWDWSSRPLFISLINI